MTILMSRPLTRLETARRLGLSAERVDQLRRAGLLPYFRTPSGPLFDPEAVERLAAKRAARRGEAPPSAA